MATPEKWDEIQETVSAILQGWEKFLLITFRQKMGHQQVNIQNYKLSTRMEHIEAPSPARRDDSGSF